MSRTVRIRKIVATRNPYQGSSVVRHAWKPGLGGNASECLIRMFEHCVDEEALGVDVTLKCVFGKHQGAIAMIRSRYSATATTNLPREVNWYRTKEDASEED